MRTNQIGIFLTITGLIVAILFGLGIYELYRSKPTHDYKNLYYNMSIPEYSNENIRYYYANFTPQFTNSNSVYNISRVPIWTRQISLEPDNNIHYILTYKINDKYYVFETTNDTEYLEKERELFESNKNVSDVRYTMHYTVKVSQ